MKPLTLTTLTAATLAQAQPMPWPTASPIPDPPAPSVFPISAEPCPAPGFTGVSYKSYNKTGCLGVPQVLDTLPFVCESGRGGSFKYSCVPNPGGLCATVNIFGDSAACIGNVSSNQPVPCDICMQDGRGTFYKLTGCGTQTPTFLSGCTDSSCGSCASSAPTPPGTCVPLPDGAGAVFSSAAPCETLVSYAMYNNVPNCLGSANVTYIPSGGCYSLFGGNSPQSIAYTCESTPRAQGAGKHDWDKVLPLLRARGL